MRILRIYCKPIKHKGGPATAGSLEQALFSNVDLRRLIVPLVIEQTLTSLMGMADTFMVSNISEAAVSGVFSVDTLNILILYIFEAMAIGGNVVCAQYIGRCDRKGAANISMQLMAAAIVLALLMTAPFLLWGDGILTFFYSSAQGDVLEAAKTYLFITAMSYPFLAVYTASAALYRAVGRPKLPVTIITIGNIINVIGNAILIFIFEMGVAGAAIATLASRVFCCMVMLWYQFKSTEIFSLKGLKGFRPDMGEIGRILRIGIPNAVENGMFQIGKIVVQGTVIYLGTTVSAAQAIIVQIEAVSLRPSLAVGIALLTVVGQCMGAGKPEQARRYALKLLALSQLFCFILCVLTIAVTPALCTLTDLSEEGSELVFELMVFICVIRLLIWPETFTLPNALRAAGDVSYPMTISVISMWVFRVMFSYIVCRYTPLGLWGVWIGWILDWLFRAVLFVMRFLKGEWMQIQILQ